MAAAVNREGHSTVTSEKPPVAAAKAAKVAISILPLKARLPVESSSRSPSPEMIAPGSTPPGSNKALFTSFFLASREKHLDEDDDE